MNLKDKMKVENEMTLALRRLGLREWRVVWDPEPSEKARGLILPDDKIILISDGKPEAAYQTLAHEYLEIRLQSMINPYHETVNALLKALEKVYYAEKERVIDSLAPLALRMLEESVGQKGDEGKEES